MNTPKSRLALAVITATASLAQSNIVVAEDNTYQPTLMKQVTVTATRSEKQLKDVAASVAVIGEEQMEKELVTDIKDLVRYEPGVTVDIAGRGGLEGFNIRGMEKNRVKIMVDGVNQTQSYSGGGDYLHSQRSFVDVETLKAVEIVKGPASSLYGSEAIGGVVAFQTKDPADMLKAEGDDTAASVKAAYSSANEGFTETLSVANRTGDLESMLIYTRRDNHETDTYGGADIQGSGRGEANPSDTGLDNLLAKVQYQVNDTHRVGITGEYLDSKTKTDLKTMSPDGVKGQDTIQRTRIGVFHEWDAGLALFDELRWQLDWQKSSTHMDTFRPTYVFPGMGTFPNRRMDYLYEDEGIQLGTQFDKALTLSGFDHNIVYGFNYNQSTVFNKNTETNLDENTVSDKSYTPKTDVKKYGVFVQDEILLTDNWTVTPSLRYDSYKYNPEGSFNNGDPATDSSGDKVTGQLGTVYDLNDNLSVFGQFSQGFKAPEFVEMYYTYGMGAKQLANPDLKPEESNSLEFGLRGDNYLGSFEITAFYNQYENFIDKAFIGKEEPGNPDSKDVYQNRNISEAVIKGVEFRGQMLLDEAIDAPTGTSLRTTVAYADGEDKDSHKKLNSVAPLTAVFGLGYDDISGDWGSELVWTLVKGKSDSDVSNRDLTGSDQDAGKQQFNPAGYGLVDLTAYYVPVEDVTLRAGLFNITDKKYYQLNDVRGRTTDYAGLDRYTQPGRNFSVSAKWDI